MEIHPILFRKINRVISLEEIEIFIKELPHKKQQAQVVSGEFYKTLQDRES